MNLRQIISRYRVVVEDRLLTAPLPGYLPRFPADKIHLEKGLSELRTQGFTALGSLLDPGQLLQLGKLFDAAVKGERPDITSVWSDSVKYWRIMNPLRLDAMLSRLAAHPLAVAMVERHFGRRPYLSDVDMRRIPPVDMKDLDKIGYSSSNWHRDTRGRQLKLMIYLSDVEETDSNFSLLPASHVGAHYRHQTSLKSRFSDDEVGGSANPPFEWYGRAGDAMLFDTNLIHRLRRKPSARLRDSLTFYYTPGQALSWLDIDIATSSALPDPARALFGVPSWPFKRIHTTESGSETLHAKCPTR